MNNKKIVWLASYPKSGNTWFRAFLTALRDSEHKVDINAMNTGGIFSNRETFDIYTDLSSSYLYDEEAKCLLPEVYTQLAKDCTDIRFIKVHDAYLRNELGQYIIPEQVTKLAIYFIRNPLDIAASLANHNGCSIDEAISLMNQPEGTFAKQPENLNINGQFRQLMLDWSGHVKSWTTISAFPVITIRYEDMLADTFNIFKQLLPHIGMEHLTDDQVRRAIAASSFHQLSTQEENKGFVERNRKGKNFFRNGQSGNWRWELNPKQIDTIIDIHKQCMKNYGYLT